MLYVGVHFKLRPLTTDFTEITSALLDGYAFKGIIENETGLIGYIERNQFDVAVTDEICKILNKAGCRAEWTMENIPEQNWNALWESNFEPVIIANRCVIRAPFHAPFNEIPIRITIEPKMSFGTGHHQTTRLMIEQMLQIDFRGKNVLDMGCGSGVLGILAAMLQASKVCCVDIDLWAYRNALENINSNQVNNVRVILGNNESIPNENFNIILANISRNILMDQMSDYARVTIPGCLLIMSGVLEEDRAVILQSATQYGFSYRGSKSLNGWISMLCERI
jgi:ribosomal protein L11 methyltransferase